MASPDKTPQELDREANQYIRPEHKMEAYRLQRDDALAEVVRLRQERDDARKEAARILSLALGKGITFDDLSVASPDMPPAGGEEQ